MRRILLCAFLASPTLALAKPVHRPKPRPAPTAPPAPAPAPAPAPEPSAEPAAPSAPSEPAPAAAATPTPPPTAAPPADKKADLDSLNAEYQAIRDELFRSRAKAELLGAALFKTRMVATFQYKAQRAWPLKRVTLRLDDQPVYAADAPSAEEPIKIYEGYTAPGRHALSVRVECAAQGDARLSYATEDTFVFDAADDKQARVELTVDETGDGPQPLAKKKQGDFDVHVRARVRSLPVEAK